MENEERIYRRIGEFVVCFQAIENKLREIGWLIIDPKRLQWPPNGLRTLTNEALINKVHDLFRQALPKCKLKPELEEDFAASFTSAAEAMHELRRNRNRILHSAFIELKAVGEVLEILRSNPKTYVDEETGEVVFDQELLSPESFANEMRMIAELHLFLGRVHTQLIHRYPDGGRETT